METKRAYGYRTTRFVLFQSKRRLRSRALVADPDSVTPPTHLENQLHVPAPAPEGVNAFHWFGGHERNHGQLATPLMIRTTRI